MAENTTNRTDATSDSGLPEVDAVHVALYLVIGEARQTSGSPTAAQTLSGDFFAVHLCNCGFGCCRFCWNHREPVDVGRPLLLGLHQEQDVQHVPHQSESPRSHLRHDPHRHRMGYCLLPKTRTLWNNRSKTCTLHSCKEAVLLLCVETRVFFSHRDFLQKSHVCLSGILKCYLWDSKHQLWTFLLCSTCNLVALNVERWISILHPGEFSSIVSGAILGASFLQSQHIFLFISVFHKTSFTKRKAKAMILFAWIIGPAFNLARYIPATQITADGRYFQNQVWPNSFWNSFVAVLVSILYLFFPLVLISCLYISIFLFLKRRGQPGNFEESVRIQSAMNKAKLNVLKTSVSLSLLFLLCWVCNIMYFFLYSISVFHTFVSPFYHFSVFMSNLTCCVNPFCYALQYKDFQNQAKFLCGKRRPHTQEAHTMESVSSVQISL